jgi:hypothetical protein
MKRSIRLILVLALPVIVAALVSTVTLAQSQSDITVVGLATDLGGVPGCSTGDGSVKIYNTSTTYEYKVWIDWRAENDSYGNPRCGTGCPPAHEPCECEQEDTYEIGTDTSVVGAPQCLMPNCGGCTEDCDNTWIGDPPQCSYDHCTCVYGTYRATHYREEGDPPEEWTTMPPSYGTAIAETERHENCPGDPGEVCGY